jgi:hypothetical protein
VDHRARQACLKIVVLQVSEPATHLRRLDNSDWAESRCRAAIVFLDSSPTMGANKLNTPGRFNGVQGTVTKNFGLSKFR